MTVIEPRSAWNARPPRRVTPRAMSHFQGVRVHHSGGSAAASVRAIQDWDMDQKGLVDIGYSYIIRDGRVFEGRGTNHPAHDSINNTFGVCVIGTYMTSLPTTADLDALVACIRELRRMTGRRLPVDGHRDVAPTACPGDTLYRHLPTIRTRADQEEDDMPSADEIAYAVWNRVNPVNDVIYGSMVRFMHNAIRPDRQQTPGARLGFLEDIDRVLGNQAAILAAVTGEDVRDAIEQHATEAREHRRQIASDLETRLEAAETERAELADLVRQAQDGELAADEVVRLIGERLLAGAEDSGAQVPTARVASDEPVTSDDD